MVLSSTDPSDHSKSCTLCQTPGHDVLVRCQVDDTGKWHLICPGPCWKRVSGGVVDGAFITHDDGDGGHDAGKDGSESGTGRGQKVNPWYRYGGMWKNKWAGVSAKMPKKNKKDKKKKKEEEERRAAKLTGLADEVEKECEDTGTSGTGDSSDSDVDWDRHKGVQDSKDEDGKINDLGAEDGETT